MTMKMQAMEIYQLACSFHQQLNLSKQELQNILMDYIPHLYIPLIMDMEEAKGLELYLQQNSSVNIDILNVVKEWVLCTCTAMCTKNQILFNCFFSDIIKYMAKIMKIFLPII